MYAPALARSSTEHVLVTVRDEDGNSQGRVLPGEVLPRVCIARAAANESVCEDLTVCKCRISTSV